MSVPWPVGLALVGGQVAISRVARGTKHLRVRALEVLTAERARFKKVEQLYTGLFCLA